MYGSGPRGRRRVLRACARFDVTSQTSVRSRRPDVVERVDLVVCGGPTHVHGLSSRTVTDGSRCRSGQAHDSLAFRSGRLGAGDDRSRVSVRAGLGGRSGAGVAAAFDTRVEGPCGVDRAGVEADRPAPPPSGFALVVEPESFLVDRAAPAAPGAKVGPRRGVGGGPRPGAGSRRARP